MIQRGSFLLVRIEEIPSEENAWSRLFAWNAKYFQKYKSYKMYKRSFILIWMFTWKCILGIFVYNSFQNVIENLLTTGLFQALTQPCPSPHFGNLNLEKWGKMHITECFPILSSLRWSRDQQYPSKVSVTRCSHTEGNPLGLTYAGPGAGLQWSLWVSSSLGYSVILWFYHPRQVSQSCFLLASSSFTPSWPCI